MIKKLLAEFAGTALLVFVGCGSMAVSETGQWSLNGFQIALFWGAVVTFAIFLFGKISGAHINPIVSLAFWINKDLSKKDLKGYLIAQVVGAISGACLLTRVVPDSKLLGSTLPHVNVFSAFSLEVLMTFFLVVVILFLAYSNSGIKKWIAPLVGLVVFLDAWIGGSYTNASMNPARTLGPAVVTGIYDHLWIYLLAPTFGSLLALSVYNISKKKSLGFKLRRKMT